MPLPANIDTLTISQIAAALQALTSVEAEALLTAIARRYPRLGRGLQVELAGYSSEISPLGLGVRTEWLALLRSGRAFVRSFLANPGVGATAQAQVFNPAASTVRVLIYAWAADSSVAATQMQVGFTSVQLGGGVSAPNLLAGGAASVAQIAVALPGALPGVTLIWQELLALGEIAGAGISTGWWAELPAGNGLDFGSLAASSAFRVNVLWAEVPSTYP